MHEQVTIDVARTRGSRHARVRVYVKPTPGEPGCAYTVGSVELEPDQALGQAAAEFLGHEMITALENARGMARAHRLAEQARQQQDVLPF